MLDVHDSVAGRFLSEHIPGFGHPLVEINDGSCVQSICIHSDLWLFTVIHMTSSSFAQECFILLSSVVP